MTRIEKAEDVKAIREELEDRFGSPPPPALRMLELCELRLDASSWGLVSLTSNDRFIVIQYSNRSRMNQLAKNSSIPIRVVDHQKAYIPIKDYDMSDPAGKAWLQLARAALWIG